MSSVIFATKPKKLYSPITFFTIYFTIAVNKYFLEAT